MLNRGGNSEHPCFFSDFRGKAFNNSPIRMMLGIPWWSSGWLGLHAFTAEGVGSIPVRGNEIPQAAWHKIKKSNKIKIK